MVGAAPRWAAETEVIHRMGAEWRIIADSGSLRRRLQVWAGEDPRLSFEDGHGLVAAAQRRDVSSWADRDQVLVALLDRFKRDPMARRMALQVVLPGIKSLIDGLRGWDCEERAARVVATAVDVLAHCADEPAGTPPSFRVYANTRRRVLREAIRERSQPVVPVKDLSQLEGVAQPSPEGKGEERQLDELVQWVRQRARVPEDVARVVVLTRAGGASVDELAATEDVDPQTMRRQRLRAEQRLRTSLSLAR